MPTPLLTWLLVTGGPDDRPSDRGAVAFGGLGNLIEETWAALETLKVMGLSLPSVRSCTKGSTLGRPGERAGDLERAVDVCAEYQEALWRCIATLEEQHIELQAKQEDLETGDSAITFVSEGCLGDRAAPIL
ncbi:hypothetical protein NDU88_003670 [Pleurodeles waltl]|uniref:Uncharacterized protein n=1 Tax=Pleurodeles waltl TaxID=8319 RepID=A0AAV7VHR6_PLEWA|nr:hypothetical protein NDU88_003670 [Pleurodeles waltl]